MTKEEVLSRLQRDQPLFHYADEEGARLSAELGYAIEPGDFSMAVTPSVLRWIADRLTEEMVTIETGAGYTTVLFAAVARHHYCCTFSEREVDRLRTYLEQIGVPADKVTFVPGSTDQSLPRLGLGKVIDLAYIDGCHGYPFPALDWHYIDGYLKIGGLVGMDNAELRPVREHCDFLEQSEVYRLKATIFEGYFVRFYEARRTEAGMDLSTV
jgi:predicted O-methyltransferase YrrM